MSVCVIIPARNAGETLAETLESLLAQHFADWRAVVIDDGSTDETRALAEHFTQRDARISVIDGPARGASAARNAGLAALAGEWVLFLDADDTLEPQMLRRMMDTLAAHPEADAVHCGWTFTDWSGEPLAQRRCALEGTAMFPAAARACAFVIHSCVFRRALLERTGGFDEALTTSEDFDLWQRIARTGARFVALDEYLVTYRLRRRQSWFDPRRFLADALTVVARGHAPDPRLAGVDLPAEFADGLPPDELYAAQVQMVAWAGGMAIAAGKDAVPLLDALPDSGAPLFDTGDIANSLLRALPLVECRRSSVWFERWAEVAPGLVDFLDALEARTGAADLAEIVLAQLELAILAELPEAPAASEAVVRLRSSAGVRVELAPGPADRALPGITRAVCHLYAGDAHLGSVVLPVFDGILPAAATADALAARFAWPMLEHLFASSIYARLADPAAGPEWAGRRALLLGEGEIPSQADLHDRIGWTVFLQELLGLPQWVPGRPASPREGDKRRWSGGREAVELSAALPTITGVEGPLHVDLLIGGAPAAALLLHSEGGIVSAERILAEVLAQGLELARVAAREAILGWSRDPAVGLRERLAIRAAERGDTGAQSIVVGEGAPPAALLASALRDLGAFDGWLIGAPAAFTPNEMARRAQLPAPLAEEMLARLAPSQPAWQVGAGAPDRAFVLPELGPALAPARIAPDTAAAAAPGIGEEGAGAIPAIYGRHHFERLFSSGADPWQYTSAYEQRKYEQTLALLPADRRGKVLEVGCAEGHFTCQLAPLVGRLKVTDISDLALERAAQRCRAADNIAYERLDILADPLAGSYEAIFCCELLYYMGGLDQLKAVGEKLAGALALGGVLITAHANLVVDDPQAPGFDWAMPYGAKRIGETFAAVPGLDFEHEVTTPLYRIQLFRKRERTGLLARFARRGGPRTQSEAEFALPEPAVAAHILWNGGKVAAAAAPVTTARLPILMYHAVADEGPAPLARWRTTPAQFDAQLRYLREAGFTPASFEEWHEARARRTPLPGRRVIITFDDIYADFERDALPILQRYGFPATLFVPSGKIGGRADWDAWSGTALPLLDTEGLRRAQAAGMRIGAHGASHRQLGGIAPADALEELWRSRVDLEQAFGGPIDCLAYPSGSFDEVAERLAAACFYRHAVTTADAPSSLGDRDLALSRIEVRGGEELADFIRRIPE